MFGYRGTSTSRIAELAGVPQPHVYANFTAKRDLFLACVSRAGEALTQAASARNDEVPDPLHVEQRLLLQAFASLDDPELGKDLRQLLMGFHKQLGQRRLEQIMAQASMLALEAGE